MLRGGSEPACGPLACLRVVCSPPLGSGVPERRIAQAGVPALPIGATTNFVEAVSELDQGFGRFDRALISAETDL